MAYKGIKELNSKAWYRLLKVVFGFLILSVLAGYNVIIALDGVTKFDSNQTMITCTQKDKRTFTPEEANLYFSDYEFREGFNYEKFFEGYGNQYDIKTILEKCYDLEPTLDVFAVQRIYEIRGTKPNEELTEADRSYMDSQIKEITTGYKTDTQKASYLDYSFKLFNIDPVYNSNRYIKFLLLGNVVIILVFEILRRVFYYVMLGTFVPDGWIKQKKNQDNQSTQEH